jgi:Flp pilus assembly protein TadD
MTSLRMLAASARIHGRMMLLLISVASTAAVGCATSHTQVQPARVTRAGDGAQRSFDRGVWLATRGDSVRAEQYFVTAIRAGHAEALVLPHLLRACLAGSRLRAARNYAESYVLRHPEAHGVRQLLASLHLALADIEAAQHELETLVALDRDQENAHYLLAVIARDHSGDTRRAHDEFAAYLARSPNGAHAAEARLWLARGSRRQGSTAMPIETTPPRPEGQP